MLHVAMQHQKPEEPSTKGAQGRRGAMIIDTAIVMIMIIVHIYMYVYIYMCIIVFTCVCIFI